MAEMQEQGFRVLCEVDDTYLIPSPTPPNTAKDWRYRLDRTKEDRSSCEAHRRIVAFADGVIVATPRLRDEYSRFNENVYLCPNSVDPNDWPEEPSYGGDTLTIGWAASSSHYFDAPLVFRALDWASRQKGVEVVLFGLKPNWKFLFRHVPWTDDLAEYRKSLEQLDIGLCPLAPNPWSLCKSDVKAMEYAMAGACSVVSDVEPYAPWRERTLTCKTDKDFLRAVKHLVTHPDEARQLAREARAYVLAERRIQDSIHLWRKAVAVDSDSGLGRRESLASIIRAR